MKKSFYFSLMMGFPIALAAQIPQKPNIIWLMAEDIGTDLECYGMKGVHTPQLNRLAEEGMRFDAAYCTGSISSPSRSAMMTGVHQNVINAHNHRSNRSLALSDSIQPITFHLRKQGYRCLVGHSLVSTRGRKTDCNYRTKTVGEWDGARNFGLFDAAEDFTADKQPFFAQIQLVKTHRGSWWKETTEQSESPVCPDSVELPPYMPDHPKVRAEWACYLDQIEAMDREVGLIMDDLEKKGLLDNTIVIFIGDNGRCDIRGKGYLYEPGIKVPLLVWGKGVKQGRVDELVSMLDVSATILDLAECELPEYLMGHPVIDRRTGRFTTGNDYVYSARDTWDEVVDCMRSVTTRRYKYIRNYVTDKGWDRHQQYLEFHRPAIHVMRQLKKEGKLNAGQLLFMADSKPAEELYDLVSDPHELHNLAADGRYGDVLAEMRGRLEDWQNKYTDCGLKDLPTRKQEEKHAVTDYVKKYLPEEWKAIEAGEICTRYRHYATQANKLMKQNEK